MRTAILTITALLAAPISAFAAERAVVFSPAPFYPDDAYLTKAEGNVTVEFDVTADGVATNIRVVEATKPGIFDDAALRTVKATRFETLTDPNAPPVHLRRALAFTMAEARVKAKPDKFKPPLYPFQAQEMGIDGACDIAFNLRPDGTAKDPKVVTCYPKGFFDQASLEAVRAGTFVPVKGPNGPEESPAFYRVSFKCDGVSQTGKPYLKPDQWIRLKYTLTETGTATDVEAIRTSEPGLSTRPAIEQLRNTKFAPLVINGSPVSSPSLEVMITGR